ncbi:uncharacterized protein LOC136084004 isoform X1 [Hydra vulgaris]|uniref:Uncharacterized protein LOC136084004 isoform X1 n=1 Tax=Hydra vulgaris TaxID=6087 RepID=A0ABM4CEF2_HYDVU
MRKEHETHANSLMQNHLSMAISKLDALENKITLTVDTLENKIASKVNALENKIMLRVDALENKIMSKVESLETKTVSKAVALENKITSKVELFENKNASEVVALENKITSTVDALKNELISKVDAQKDEIMLHEKNLEIIKAFLAVKTMNPKNFCGSSKKLKTPFRETVFLVDQLQLSYVSDVSCKSDINFIISESESEYTNSESKSGVSDSNAQQQAPQSPSDKTYPLLQPPPRVRQTQKKKGSLIRKIKKADDAEQINLPFLNSNNEEGDGNINSDEPMSYVR